ncbi:BlaI/MecI/CopY family transcriptional regulator [Streptomyces zhihengii]|uniref:BlaI/MecI/CopY family transcriptional regulator n=1 Tax=Streptomyces zhihengii TaxID=1818004 RepID=A0ABS2V5N8_9ACTN|nr:BlaI/MecI/CopY family transcriptional regulator [Streptomyces zhihengii]MBM9624588.1 BlaI/MecI/CopY family transcriptional regulator [Streptomyces zhihengii]
MVDEPAMNPIRNRYVQQYADDLAANRDEQATIGQQVADLQQRLKTLEEEERWLVQAQSSLPERAVLSATEDVPLGPPADVEGTGIPTLAADPAEVSDTVPQPRDSKSRRKETTHGEKTARAGRKTAANRPSRPSREVSAAAVTGQNQQDNGSRRTGPPLGQLLLAILLKTPGEPCVVREVSDQLAQDHPSRATSVQTVRNTLEILVKKGTVEKSRQQGNAMYTAYAVSGAGDTSQDGQASTPTERVAAEA